MTCRIDGKHGALCSGTLGKRGGHPSLPLLTATGGLLNGRTPIQCTGTQWSRERSSAGGMLVRVDFCCLASIGNILRTHENR